MLSLLITLLVVCLIIGLVYWALQQIPMPQPVKAIVTVVLVVIACIYLLTLIPGVHAGL